MRRKKLYKESFWSMFFTGVPILSHTELSAYPSKAAIGDGNR
jgi:hypothetical protein